MSPQAPGPPNPLKAFLDFVEWPAVRKLIAQRASSTPGANRALDLVPWTDAAEIARRVQRTAESLELVDRDEAPDLERLSDVGAAYHRSDRQGLSLSARDLRGLASTIRIGEAARRIHAGLPTLEELLDPDDPELLEADRDWAIRVQEVIGGYGRLVDDASKQLLAIRRALGEAEAALKGALSKAARDPRITPALLDTSPVDRRGQLCLKVRADEVRRVPGPILGEEGHALFVEPDLARAEYNRLRHLEVDERQESQRITRALAEEIEPRRDAHIALALGLIEADLHQALARLALDMELTRPSAGAVSLQGVRHPLLIQEGHCVPVDLTLTGDLRLVVISGPNGGGKTVAMKTLGLAAVLAQCGGYVPAGEGARLPVFDRFVSVAAPSTGIEVGLSTFQAHAADLAAALPLLGPGALALLDEVGVGTDPGEAAALAQAVLEHALSAGGVTLSTTHLGPLKAFAGQTRGAANAAVGLDADGHPTFQLRLGEAGSSFALEVARTQGLPESVCERAHQLHRGQG